MTNTPSPEHSTVAPSVPPPAGTPATSETADGSVWDDARAMYRKHKSALFRALPKLLWALLIALASYVYYLHTVISDIKSEQKLFRAETETAIGAEFSKQKEMFWKEQKQPIDTVRLFTDTFECQAKLRSNNNSKRYGESIRVFQDFCKHTPLDAIPSSLKCSLFEEAVRAYSIQGAYPQLTESELAYMENVFREEMACNWTQFYVATIYLGKGQPDKARMACNTGMRAIHDAIHLSDSVYVCRPGLGVELPDYYALMVLIELATPRSRTAEATIRDCWAVLQVCERRTIVYTVQIAQCLDRSSLLALTAHLKLAQPTVFANLFQSMKRELGNYDFIVDTDERDLPSTLGGGRPEMKVKRITRSEWESRFFRPVEMLTPKDK
jgi:hypothetical protein